MAADDLKSMYAEREMCIRERYGLVEIKLGGDRLINEGAENLQKLAEKINTDKMNADGSHPAGIQTGEQV